MADTFCHANFRHTIFPKFWKMLQYGCTCVHVYTLLWSAGINHPPFMHVFALYTCVYIKICTVQSCTYILITHANSHISIHSSKTHMYYALLVFWLAGPKSTLREGLWRHCKPNVRPVYGGAEHSIYCHVSHLIKSNLSTAPYNGSNLKVIEFELSINVKQ